MFALWSIVGRVLVTSQKNQSTKLTWLTSKKLAAAGFARRDHGSLGANTFG